MSSDHFSKLERMYLSSNINTMIYDTTTIQIAEGTAVVGLMLSDKYYHALGAMHGSVYFKLLDDACFFAVSSLVSDVFVLTTAFDIKLTRPASSGRIMATGLVTEPGEKVFHATGELHDEEGRLLASGRGTFVRSREPLKQEIGYY